MRQTVYDRDSSDYRYKIEGSNNTTTWTTLADRTTTPRTGPVLQDLVSGTYRHVRITMTGATNGHWATSSELQLMID